MRSIAILCCQASASSRGIRCELLPVAPERRATARFNGSHLLETYCILPARRDRSQSQEISYEGIDTCSLCRPIRIRVSSTLLAMVAVKILEKTIQWCRVHTRVSADAQHKWAHQLLVAKPTLDTCCCSANRKILRSFLFLTMNRSYIFLHSSH